MTISVLAPEEQAAIPAAIAAIQAFQAFEASMGPDPSKWVGRYVGSKLILLGTLANLVPTVLTSEVGAVESQISGVESGWITKLQAAQTATATPTPTVTPAA